MADKPRPIIPLTLKSQAANTQSKARQTLVPPRPIIPVGVAANKPSILRGWFAGVIENIPFRTKDQKFDNIKGNLFVDPSLGNKPADIVSNLRIAIPVPRSTDSILATAIENLKNIGIETEVSDDRAIDVVGVKADSFNPVYKRIAGILSRRHNIIKTEDFLSGNYGDQVTDNSVLSLYYEMAKRRSANFLSRGQTSEMTDALFAGKLYKQLEGIESAFGSSGSLRRGFNLSGQNVTGSVGKNSPFAGIDTPSQIDPFESTNLIFSIGRPQPDALIPTQGKFKLFHGGGTYFDSRALDPEDQALDAKFHHYRPLSYASDMALPGYEKSPGAITYLSKQYSTSRFNEFYTTRHEIGHHIHQEIKRLHVRAREPMILGSTDRFYSDYESRASAMARKFSEFPSFKSTANVPVGARDAKKSHHGSLDQ